MIGTKTRSHINYLQTLSIPHFAFSHNFFLCWCFSLGKERKSPEIPLHFLCLRLLSRVHFGTFCEIFNTFVSSLFGWKVFCEFVSVAFGWKFWEEKKSSSELTAEVSCNSIKLICGEKTTYCNFLKNLRNREALIRHSNHPGLGFRNEYVKLTALCDCEALLTLEILNHEIVVHQSSAWNVCSFYFVFNTFMHITFSQTPEIFYMKIENLTSDSSSFKWFNNFFLHNSW